MIKVSLDDQARDGRYIAKIHLEPLVLVVGWQPEAGTLKGKFIFDERVLCVLVSSVNRSPEPSVYLEWTYSIARKAHFKVCICGYKLERPASKPLQEYCIGFSTTLCR